MYCTMADVKKSIKWATTEVQMDSLVADLIGDVASRIDESLGSLGPLHYATWTEQYDGGLDSLLLRHRPVESVTSVKDDISWAFGSGTVVDSATYVLDKRLSIIHFVNYCPAAGKQNVQIIYPGGYRTIPGLVRRLAVEMVVAHLKQRENPAVVTKGDRSGNLTRTPADQWDKTIARRLLPLTGHSVT